MGLPPLGPGDEFAGKYRLEDLFQQGQFSDAWRATRLKDGLPVVLKSLGQDHAHDPQALARFVREVKILAGFRHPNMLRVLAVGRSGGAPYLVLERVQGRSLADEISSLELAVDDVCHIAGQIASVLAGAHAQGIVHRGLSPEAVYLTEEDGDPYRVKVLDFGLAHLSPSAGGEQLTALHQRLGRAEYWAPEYIEDEQLDARSDLYVLGILTFEMLCAQPPFVGPARRVLTQQVETPARPPSYLSVHEIPGWLDALVLGLLEKDPAARPQSAEQISRAFAERRWSA